MDEVITKEIFEELVLTGRLQLDADEAEHLRSEMNLQMHMIRQLEAIPLDGSLPPVIHGNPYPPQIRCALREDEIRPFEDAAAITAQFPKSRDGYIVSPDIEHRKIG